MRTEHRSLAIGTHVEVRSSYTGEFAPGFVVVGQVGSRYRIRRARDGAIMPTWFDESEVRPTRRLVSGALCASTDPGTQESEEEKRKREPESGVTRRKRQRGLEVDFAAVLGDGTIKLYGELTCDNRHSLDAVLDLALREMPRQLQIDLTAIDSVDASVFDELERLRRHLGQWNGTLNVLVPSGGFRGAQECTGHDNTGRSNSQWGAPSVSRRQTPVSLVGATTVAVAAAHHSS